MTWKQVFDSGFKPKHLDGLQHNQCVCYDQSFLLQFRDREQRFKIENGRLTFTFGHDDFLRMIWHQGAEAITLEEGKKRAAEFRNIFDGFIVQEISMPRLIDPSGLVEAGNDENNVKARIGEYLITYGFDNSMRKDRQLIPHFYITWTFPGMPQVRPKNVRDVVRPPVGYEWYSLDPKIDTPAPDVRREVIPDTAAITSTGGGSRESKTSKLGREAKPHQNGVAWLWRIAFGIGVILAALLLGRLLSKRGA